MENTLRTRYKKNCSFVALITIYYLSVINKDPVGRSPYSQFWLNGEVFRKYFWNEMRNEKWDEMTNCLLCNHLAEIFSISEIVHDALWGGQLEAAQHQDGPVETLHSHDSPLPPPPHSNQWHVLILTEDYQAAPGGGRCRWAPAVTTSSSTLYLPPTAYNNN